MDMVTDERQQKIKALRDGLRDGRTTAASTASADIDADSRDDDTAFRTAFKDTTGELASVGRDSLQHETNHRESAGNRRSTQAKSRRLRQADRRLGESDGGTASDTAADNTDNSIGRVIADGPIKERKLNPDKPQGSFSTEAPNQTEEATKKGIGGWPKGKPRKPRDGVAAGGQQQQAPTIPQEKKSFIPTIRKGNVLSAKEVAELSEPFISALESDFNALDMYLWSRQKVVGQDTHEQPVWSDLDTEELQALTRVMMKWGQHNETAATVVRGVIDASDYVAVGTVFVPRIKRTVEIMRETRKPRAKRGQVQQSESSN